jgi:hypothetical protein
MAHWNTGWSVRFMMFSVFPGSSRYMLGTVPNCSAAIDPCHFFLHPSTKMQIFFFINTCSLSSLPHWRAHTRDAQILHAYAPRQLSFVQWHLTFSAHLLQFFPLTHKLSTTTHAPSIKAPCHRKVHNSLQKCDPQYGTCFTSPFWHLEVGGGSYIFLKFVDPWHTMSINRHISYSMLIFFTCKIQINTKSKDFALLRATQHEIREIKDIHKFHCLMVVTSWV